MANIEGFTWLCTFEVKNHIPYVEGCEAKQAKINVNSELSNRDISFFMTLLDIILTRNYFWFGNDY